LIQAGDGDGTADGRPWGSNDLGYTIPDELPASSSEYVDGTLAMANAKNQPNSGSSQFFVVLPAGAGLPTPQYSIFGRVVSGHDVVAKIGTLNVTGRTSAKYAAVIQKVTIDERK
jgi:cyclophilin family peptidyl-prolyl cis-trans isomerase